MRSYEWNHERKIYLYCITGGKKFYDKVYKENIFFAKYVQEKNMDKINRHVENINKIKSVVMSIKENLDCSVLKKV